MVDSSLQISIHFEIALSLHYLHDLHRVYPIIHKSVAPRNRDVSLRAHYQLMEVELWFIGLRMHLDIWNNSTETEDLI